MDYSLKKTNELDQSEKEQICILFEAAFGQKKRVEAFDRQFTATYTGSSYHGLMIDSGKIVGCYTAVPVRYRFFGALTTFALSVDTMIHPDYQGNAFNTKRMGELVYRKLAADGVSFVFGFPNEQIHKVRRRVLRWKDIGRLSFYVLPIRIGGFKSSLALLNGVTAQAAYLATRLVPAPDLARWNHYSAYPIEKVVDGPFLAQRYDARHRIIHMASGYFAYRIKPYGAARVAYLMDVKPLSTENVASGIRAIFDAEHALDAVLYVGNLEFRPKCALRLPTRLEPRSVVLSGRILDRNRVDSRIFELANWCINLSSFDFY